MNVTVITPPQFEPVSLADCYRQLRLTPDSVGSPGEESHPDDLLLAGHITAAREHVEVATRRALVQRTLRLSTGGYPASCRGWGWPLSRNWWGDEAIRLRHPPLIRVDIVGFYDTSNALQVVSPNDYYVTDEQLPELRFSSGLVPASLYDRPDALRVEYVAGYAPVGSPPSTQADFAAAIPQTLKNAVLIGVQLLYDNLSPADRAAMENMREAMLQTYRIQHLP